MVLRIKQLSVELSEVFSDAITHPELFLEPEGHGFQKRGQTGWCKCKICFKESFELEKRFVVKSHMGERLCIYAAFIKTVSYGMFRESVVVLFPREPFFLSRSYNPAIMHQAGS